MDVATQQRSRPAAVLRPLPELAAQREDGFVPGAWVITEGDVRRGSAYCNLQDRELCVPTDDTPTARVVRAHELMHARVSPLPDEIRALVGPTVHPRAFECAEECRVNYLIGCAGFDTDLLCDGSEKEGGEEVAASGDWAEAVCFLAAVLGTGGEKPFLAGIRKVQPEWVAPLRAIAKRLRAILQGVSVTNAASTAPTFGPEEPLSVGVATTTAPIARLLTGVMSAKVPQNADQQRVFRRSLEPGGRRPLAGVFASLNWLDQPEFTHVTARGSRRAQKPAVSGSHLRYPGRLLTDPQRRIMASTRRRGGGIVIVDQSGSMDLNDVVIADFAKKHPQALLVGYSHSPGSVPGTKPNAWILAKNQRVANTLPVGNVGNGVDGPILEWAIAQRRGTEPLIWVCDGQVTDANDYPVEELTAYCVHLVKKHRIRMVRSLNDVTGALVHPRLNTPTEMYSFGRVGRLLLEKP